MQTITKPISRSPGYSPGLPQIPSIAQHANHFRIYPLSGIGQQPFSIFPGANKEQVELIWIKGGSSYIQTEGSRQLVTGNAIYCLSPWHNRKLFSPENAEGFYISFSPEFIHLSPASWMGDFDYSSNYISIPVEEDMQNELDFIAKKMICEFAGNSNRRAVLLQGLLNVFPLYISHNREESNPDTSATRENELVRNFMRLLKKNFIRNKMVSDYASDLCVTPNYLNRTIKKATGHTASHHIQQKIMLEAKKQALHSSVSMKEIAYNLGFDNIAHFSKFFKLNCGMNFTEFKKTQLLRYPGQP